ncbi:hypothetical protein CMI47_13205 [Candidatus Pacearchaeota archaeon]|nr:hypothetical protein [Candidatus Pacearchaeota archaeon]|tara:strand:- start:148 stop:345 length:198 start_codon:yes stop_codon:yes gene_type:complete
MYTKKMITIYLDDNDIKEFLLERLNKEYADHLLENHFCIDFVDGKLAVSIDGEIPDKQIVALQNS